MPIQSFSGTAGAGDLKYAVADTDKSGGELPLGSVYRLSPEQTSFFKAQTGIENDDDLRTHILDVQRRAFKIFPYVCISELTFLQLGIASLPEYETILRLGRERPDGILLDIGCCFGVDARKAIADGYPIKNVVTTDLIKAFADLGHELFKTTPETYPISFVSGDAFEPDMLQIVPPLMEEPCCAEGVDVSTLTSLDPLAGRCAVIYAANFFHLFSEERQLHLAKALGGLLSPRPGSMICGMHVGNREKGTYRQEFQRQEIDMFQHSPETWCAVWEDVFGKGVVRVDVRLEPVETSVFEYLQLQWSVVRL